MKAPGNSLRNNNVNVTRQEFWDKNFFVTSGTVKFSDTQTMMSATTEVEAGELSPIAKAAARRCAATSASRAVAAWSRQRTALRKIHSPGLARWSMPTNGLI